LPPTPILSISNIFTFYLSKLILSSGTGGENG
jgi:hypothetical protein